MNRYRLLIILSIAAMMSHIHASEEFFGLDAGVFSPTTLNDGDPISTATGSFYEDWQLLSLGGPMELGFTLHYRPELWNHFPTDRMQRLDAGFGVFTCNHTIELIDMTRVNSPERSACILFGDHEAIMTYDAATAQFKATGSVPYRLVMDHSKYILTDPLNERVFIFKQVPDAFYDLNGFNSNWWGRIETILDRNGNTLSYNYTNEISPRLKSVTDGLGRSIEFIYEGEWMPLASITDSYGRTFNFTSAGYSFSSMTDPMGQTTQFIMGPDDHSQLIQQIIRPEGNSHIDQTWTSTPRGEWFFGVASQKDAYGNETILTYSPDVNDARVMFTFPDGTTSQVASALERYPTNLIDPNGDQATFAYNDQYQLSSITDRLGQTTQTSYHPVSGKLAQVTNAKGHTITHTYAAQTQTFTDPVDQQTFQIMFYNRIRTDYPDGTCETFVYDDHGNLTEHTKSCGQTWTTTFNDRGQPLTETNPEDGVTTWTYHEDSTLASIRTSDTDLTIYTYDAYKRVSNVNHPGPGQIAITYNLLDQITSLTDENDHVYTYDYDKNGNLIQVTDPNSQIIQYAFDLMDRVSQVTSRTGGIDQYSYDFNHDITQTINANGIETAFTYNNDHRLASVTRDDKTYHLTQDAEGIPTSLTTPAGHTETYQSDALGQITAQTQPDGSAVTIEYDTMGRVTKTTDALDRVTQYTYTDQALTQVTTPDGHSVSYTYNILGNLTDILDLNQNPWHFTYSAMGHRSTSMDPLGRTRQYSRDDRTRVTRITYEDGSVESRSLDPVGNITERTFTDGTTLNYTYDALDNLIATNELTLTRDAEERITSSTSQGHTFGVTHDAGGRISTATYSPDLTITYSYNASDLLSQVSDTLSNTIDFEYDPDGNLIRLTRSNGIHAELTWNPNGQLTQLHDGDFLNLTFEYDLAGQLIGTSGQFPWMQQTPFNRISMHTLLMPPVKSVRPALNTMIVVGSSKVQAMA